MRNTGQTRPTQTRRKSRRTRAVLRIPRHSARAPIPGSGRPLIGPPAQHGPAPAFGMTKGISIRRRVSVPRQTKTAKTTYGWGLDPWSGPLPGTGVALARSLGPRDTPSRDVVDEPRPIGRVIRRLHPLPL